MMARAAGPTAAKNPVAATHLSFGTDVLMVAERALGDVFDSIMPLVDLFAGLVSGLSDSPVSSDLATLRPAIFDVLRRHDGVVGGAGVVTAPGLLRDRSHWLEWWWTGDHGKPEALRVDPDPVAPDFFDYVTADWYATPLRTGRRRTAGPYVDYICSNEYSLTLSVPVFVDREALGVAAADVLISSLEQLVLPALLRLPRLTALASADGRIIASNSPHWLPADRLPPAIRSRSDQTAGAPELAQTGDIPWYLVDLEDALADHPAADRSGI